LIPKQTSCSPPLAPLSVSGINGEALLGTDNFDFLLEGVPNLVADQQADRYLADYHAESDTFDKVDLELPSIEADAGQIQQLIMNLVINGAESIGPEGGSLWVSTTTAGREVCMEVRDSGAGGMRQPRRLGPVADDEDDFGRVSGVGGGVDQRLQVRSAARNQNAHL